MKKQNIKVNCNFCNNLVDIKLWEIRGKNKRNYHFCNQQCRYKWQKTQPGFFRGKKHTIASNLKNSIAHKGKSSWIKGRRHTEESKNKMHLSRLKFILEHPEIIEKTRVFMTGRKQLRETVLKRILKTRGQKRSIQQRKNISANIPRGEDNHFWKGGVSKLSHIIRNCSSYKIWRTSIYKRDNWTCQECKRNKVYLNPHHLKSFSKIISEHQIRTLEEALNCKELWDINNGITLCQECHKKTNNYGNNRC